MTQLKRDEEAEKRLGQKLRKNSSTESFQKAYDEFYEHTLLYEGRGNLSEYKKNPSHFDRMILNLIGKNNKVLDIGCGDGTLAIACAKNNNDVVGIDVSKVMIRLANARKGNLPIEFRVEDARYLEFPDESFDVVVSKEVIEHLPKDNLEIFFRGVWRVLKRKGYLLLFTPPKLLGDLSFGAHLKMYSLNDLCPILKKNNFLVNLVCLFPFILGLPCKVSNSLLASCLAYEKMLERFRVGYYLGNYIKKSKRWKVLSWMGFSIIPPPWFCAYKVSF